MLEAHAPAAVPVIGTAWQARAAEVVGREAGVESQATALLMQRRARGEEPIPRGAIVDDEHEPVLTISSRR